MNAKDKILKIFEGNPLYENFRLGYWRMRTRKSQKELEENAKKRANGFDDRQFSRLKEFENKYNGERCFIIATFLRNTGQICLRRHAGCDKKHKI